MKNIFKFSIFILSLFFILSPFLLMAQSSNLIPCETVAHPGISSPVGKYNCGFNEFLTLGNNIINFVLFKLAMPIAAIMFAYAGVLYMASGFKPGNKDTAKKIFGGVVKGFIVAAAAWLIVKLVLTVLGYDGAWIGF